MKGDAIRRQVLEAVKRGELPRGGPSELIAHDLLDEVPAGYLERWANESAERIRASAAARLKEMGR